MLISTYLIVSSLFFNNPPTTQIYTLSLHDLFRSANPWIAELDVLPFNQIYVAGERSKSFAGAGIERLVSRLRNLSTERSEEHTSELQSRQYLVCRLLLEKKKPNLDCTNIIHPDPT